MQKTEKKHWLNGTHLRGRDFYTVAKSFKNISFLLAFSRSKKYFSLEFFKLI